MIIISLKNAIDVWEKKKPVGIVVDVIEFITFTPNDINGWEKGANHPGDDGKKRGLLTQLFSPVWSSFATIFRILSCEVYPLVI